MGVLLENGRGSKGRESIPEAPVHPHHTVPPLGIHRVPTARLGAISRAATSYLTMEECHTFVTSSVKQLSQRARTVWPMGAAAGQHDLERSDGLCNTPPNGNGFTADIYMEEAIKLDPPSDFVSRLQWDPGDVKRPAANIRNQKAGQYPTGPQR